MRDVLLWYKIPISLERCWHRRAAGFLIFTCCFCYYTESDRKRPHCGRVTVASSWKKKNTHTDTQGSGSKNLARNRLNNMKRPKRISAKTMLWRICCQRNLSLRELNYTSQCMHMYVPTFKIFLPMHFLSICVITRFFQF